MTTLDAGAPGPDVRSSARRVARTGFVLVTVACALAAWVRATDADDEKRALSPDAHRDAVQRGVALGLFATDPDYDYGPLVREIAELGATHLQLDVVWVQDDVRAADIRPVSGISPSDATVVRTMRQALSHGMSTTIFPILRLGRREAGEWRGTIAPAAGVDAWFSSYGAFVLRMADLATQGGAQRLSVGSELVSLEQHDARWRTLIAAVRARFAGGLLYSANWDHFVEVPFWDALDEAGVTAYFELTRTAELPSSDALASAWEGPRAQLGAWRARVRLPVVITEVGYPSIVGAARAPWDETRRAPIDLDGQARLLAAFCDAFAGHEVVAGFYIWNWFGWGGLHDAGYTPRGKPGANVVGRCMARSW